MSLESLSIFIGTGECNANCTHCAGAPLRKYAPTQDGIIDAGLVRKTLVECYARGARRLSLSSSGEPTLSPTAVTKALEIVSEYAHTGHAYNPVNLYTNGIRIGQDLDFCEEYLPVWKRLGLTTVYVTVHSADERKNALQYNVENYPSLKNIVWRIMGAGLLTRANLVLSKESISTFAEFVSTSIYLLKIGFGKVSAWPIRTLDDKVDITLSPPEIQLDRMESWVEEMQGRNRIGNSIGNRVTILREKSRERYQRGEKLTLFPDGTLSSTWCNS